MASQAQPAASLRGNRARPRAISAWLLAVAALVFLMIVVGGITRLTESGLSIVRWEPVSGAVPPLDTEGWEKEFAAYRDSPQYREVNRGMSLDEFKQIYFWEYVHRLLGRIIGIAFALPFLWFASRRAVPPGYGWRLTALLALGGLQGAVGWWMVASGLILRPEVSHIRLAVHLLIAFLIFAGLIWTALDLRSLARDPAARPARMPTAAIWTLSLLGVQFLFGAYVAGLEAGQAFSTWPKMGDEYYPSGAPMFEPFLRNFVDNPVMVQFVHRWLAFAVAAMTIVLAVQAWRRRLPLHATAILLAVTVQILIGIMTLLSGVDLWIAVAHQAMATLLLGTLVVAAHRLGERAA